MNSPLSLDGVPTNMRLKVSDSIARAYVQGERKYSIKGEDVWQPIVCNIHERFTSHPWVREAITEGWDRELRSHMVGAAKRLLLEGKSLNGVVAGDLVPRDRKTLDVWRDAAGRASAAAEWRERICADHGTMDAYLTKSRGSKSGFKPIVPDRNYFVARGWAPGTPLVPPKPTQEDAP
jgi:hypothetical protein